ncbi:MAG: hypothetical protein IPN08_15150 [Bacteroidales bacterium]|nr:hypothetical protein [Bacteroidales bacterium]MBK9358692.1 hypothetical protein [Bacteroidales bacterium]
MATLKTRNSLKNIAGFALGVAGGFIYYKTIGCSSGSCAITSNPYMSMLWGGLLGYLLADIFKLKDAKKGGENVGETEA